MPVKKYKADKGKADKLFSQIIRSQGFCEAEGWATRPCSNQIQTAHIITRGRSATRTDTRNAFALCFAHHRYFHDYPREFSRFITSTWAADFYDLVYQKSQARIKTDWQERVGFLMRIVSGELTINEARKLEE